MRRALLAAGMGSRYGGLKQLDGLGPNGETIMDYITRWWPDRLHAPNRCALPAPRRTR